MALELGEVFGYKPLVINTEDIGKSLLSESLEWQRYFNHRILKETDTRTLLKKDMDVICEIA